MVGNLDLIRNLTGESQSDEKCGKSMTKITVRRILNALIVVMVFGAWFFMMFRSQARSGATLQAAGLGSLKYYTILSNLLAGIAAIFWLYTSLSATSLRALRGRGMHIGGGRSTHTAEVLKYAATVSVSLTFLVVIFFLAPTMGGLLKMYQGANLFLHLIVPVVCIAEQILFRDEELTRGENFLAVVPTLLYGIVYLGNIILNGRGSGKSTNDWYGFARWGIPVGFVIFAVIAAVTFGVGALLRQLRRRSWHKAGRS